MRDATKAEERALASREALVDQLGAAEALAVHAQAVVRSQAAEICALEHDRMQLLAALRQLSESKLAALKAVAPSWGERNWVHC